MTPQPCANCGGDHGGPKWLCAACAPEFEPAIAMETGTGETRTRLDPKDDSAGRDGIAGKDIA